MQNENLHSEVEIFLKNSSLGPVTFGKEALGDPNFVYDLRAGRECRRKTIDQVRKFISDFKKVS